MQADADYRRRLEDIANLYVANRSGQMVPLGALLGIRRIHGSELITRYNLYPAVPLIGTPAAEFSSGEAIAIMERVADANLPLNVGYSWTGLSYQEKLIGNQAYFIFASVHHAGLFGTGRPVRKLDGPRRRRSHGADGPRRRDSRPDRPALAERPVHADRARADDRPGCQECDSDRRGRARDQGGRSIRARGRRRGHTPALPPDRDDLDRVHPGRGSAHDGDGCRSRQPTIARHRSLRWDARLDAAGNPVRVRSSTS